MCIRDSYWENSWTASLQVYSGICVGISESVDANDAPVTTAQFSGPLAKLDDSKPLTLTQEWLQGIDSSDTFLDKVHLSNEVQWGTKVGGKPSTRKTT